MTAPELHALARCSADFARMARFHQQALEAKGKTWLAAQAAVVAGELATEHSIEALEFDRAACRLARGVE